MGNNKSSPKSKNTSEPLAKSEEPKTTEPSSTNAKEYAKSAKATPDMFNLDVCFMIDCTGSMQDYIAMTQRKVCEIIDQLVNNFHIEE